MLQSENESYVTDPFICYIINPTVARQSDRLGFGESGKYLEVLSGHLPPPSDRDKDLSNVL